MNKPSALVFVGLLAVGVLSACSAPPTTVVTSTSAPAVVVADPSTPLNTPMVTLGPLDRIVVDQQTGCQYLVPFVSGRSVGMTPRLDRSGHPMCGTPQAIPAADGSVSRAAKQAN